MAQNNYNPLYHHRKSIRLKEFDYTTPWWYYITICTFDHKNFFGKIEEGKILLNEYGKIVEEEWLKTKELRKNIDLDYYVVMPNHFHGILIIDCRDTMHRVPTERKFGNSIAGSLSTIIGAFKAAVTRKINLLKRTSLEKVWQKNYYEHIIRNEKDLFNIRQYIKLNPLKCDLDEYLK